MTPGARLAAAIEVMDQILGGDRAEKALTAWGRRSRFAGSGDRRAVRDHVYDMLRRQRSYAALGGAFTGRGMAIGALRAAGQDPATLMTGDGHAPDPPTAEETARPATAAELADMPNWLFDVLIGDWGDQAATIAKALRDRAPTFLRVNLARGDRDNARAMLTRDGITAEPSEKVRTALKVVENERKISSSRAYLDGYVELQDASSQAAVLALPVTPDDRVLDFCAGGGGKSLALAGLGLRDITAHDAFPARMRDLPVRAARAGCDIAVRTVPDLPAAGFDMVLVDAPCSGSGTWRRDPEGKWRLIPEDLAELTRVQHDVLAAARRFVRSGGQLAYVTCSVLRAENDAVVAEFIERNPDLAVVHRMQTLPGPEGDGFYLCVMEVAHPAI